MNNGLFYFQLSASATLSPIDTAKIHCPAMSQRATIELRVLHVGVMYSTSLNNLVPLPYKSAF